MENILQPWVSWSIWQNNNHQAVKMEWIENGKYDKIQTKNPLGFRLCVVVSVWVDNSSILDIEHFPYYIAFGSTHNHKVI